MKRVLLTGAFLFVPWLGGCGTARNFTEGWQGRTEPYGGVKIAAKKFDGAHDVELAWNLPFWTTDLVLSAIGDTATLPVTVPARFIHAISDSINDYYLPPERNPQPDESRQFWFDGPRPDRGHETESNVGSVKRKESARNP